MRYCAFYEARIKTGLSTWNVSFRTSRYAYHRLNILKLIDGADRSSLVTPILASSPA